MLSAPPSASSAPGLSWQAGTHLASAGLASTRAEMTQGWLLGVCGPRAQRERLLDVRSGSALVGPSAGCASAGAWCVQAPGHGERRRCLRCCFFSF